MKTYTLLLVLIVAHYCKCSVLLDQLEQHFDKKTAAIYEQQLLNTGLTDDTYVTYRALSDAGIKGVHNQLMVMQVLRSVSGESASQSLPARLIFSVNTGRSGSCYLASILNSCEKVVGEHEPRPGAGGARNMMHESWQESFKQRQQLKTVAIRRAMASTKARNKAATIYAETNPNFKVWFWDVVIDEFGAQEGKRMDILIIRKYIPALVKSIYELGWFQYGNKGENWLPTANGVNSLIQPLADDDELDAYDKIISSIINTEAVAQHMVQLFSDPSSEHYLPNVIFHEYRSEQLFDGQQLLNILERDLLLQPTEETQQLAGVKIDKYRVGSQHSGKLKGNAHKRHTTLQECERRVKEYISKCEERGIWLPELPHLQPYPGFNYE